MNELGKIAIVATLNGAGGALAAHLSTSIHPLGGACFALTRWGVKKVVQLVISNVAIQGFDLKSKPKSLVATLASRIMQCLQCNSHYIGLGCGYLLLRSSQNSFSKSPINFANVAVISLVTNALVLSIPKTIGVLFGEEEFDYTISEFMNRYF